MDYNSFKYHFNGICQITSLLVIFGQLFVLLYIWVMAYIVPEKVVLVYVDIYGEAFPELIMWIVMLPYLTYGFYLNYKMITKNFKR